MKRTIIKVVYLLILGLFVFLAAKGVIQGKGSPEEIAEKIVEIEDAKILEENEGKLVLISGKMKTKEILEFKEQGVKVNSPVLERNVEFYQYMRDEDNYDLIVRGWSNEEPESRLKDIKTGEIYTNPFQAIESDAKYASVTIGDFTIDAEIIKYMQPNAVVTVFDPIPHGYRVMEDTILTNTLENQVEIGNYRMEFYYLDLDLDETNEYTFIGQQKDGKIEEYKLDTGRGVLQNFEGVLNKDEVVEEFRKRETRGQYVSFILLGIIAVIGFFVFKPQKEVA